MEEKLRLSLDVGTNSIGWALFKLNKTGEVIKLQDAGARIFSDGRIPKTGEPLAVNRRTARGCRRRIDRNVQKRKTLFNFLLRLNLIPKDKNEKEALKGVDIYALRAKAVREKVEAYELGRVFYHLGQRRGFLSNRKINKTDESKINGPRIKAFASLLDDNKFLSLGDYLYRQKLERKQVRFRSGSEYYPDRQLYLKEFDKIVEVQSLFFNHLAQDDWNKLKNILFYQRPLKSQKGLIGKCEIFTDEVRAPKASILFQRHRILQSLANLKIIEQNGETQEICVKDKARIYEKLKTREKMTFDQVRKELGLKGGEIFNLESEKNKKIDGDHVFYKFKKILGENISNYSINELESIIEELLSERSDDEVFGKINTLVKDEAIAQNIFELNLPDSYGSLSLKALSFLVPRLETEFCSPELLIRGLKGEDVSKNILDRLPYYGKVLISSVVGGKGEGKTNEEIYGRISNPTVHICLNQIRKVVNEIMSKYGKMDSIVLEVTRDLKNSKKKKIEINKRQTQEQKNNERIKGILLKEHSISSPTRDDIEKYKLWEELGGNDINNRKCPYTLKPIPCSKLFSDEIEVEHILPFSRTLDDSFANKTLSYVSANRKKGNRSPFEAFGDSSNWSDIVIYSQHLPLNKKWRFLNAAMDRFGADGGFLNRQLNDTAYIAKIGHKYLKSICENIYVVPGRLTSLVRHHLGLNLILNEENVKNRQKSHKHHAVDAVVIGLMTRSFLQKAARMSDNERNKIKFEVPYSNFHNDVRDIIKKIIVSRKEDHAVNNEFHEATYYGLTEDSHIPYEIEHGYNLVTRKPIDALKEKDSDKIRDKKIRENIEKIGFENVIKDLKNNGTRSLRFLKKNKSVEVIKHKEDKLYKAVIPGGVHSIEIWKIPAHVSRESKINVEEQIEVIAYTYFERAKKIIKKPNFPTAKRLFTLCKGDTVFFKEDGQEYIMNVKTLKPSNNLIGVVPLDSVKREDSEARWPTFSSFKTKELRKIKLNAIGDYIDNGNPYV